MSAQTSPRELARALALGCRTVDELAARVAVSADRVRAVLATMIARRLVRADGDGFVLTDIGHHARRDQP